MNEKQSFFIFIIENKYFHIVYVKEYDFCFFFRLIYHINNGKKYKNVRKR